ncbi:MAG: NAD-dependent epimerase/dehydratase family protein [Deltaproteobacteria bacterium]|nr:NAD-dependent epimerase/dehydratase family protein [Deltaproteobacteria bacterium]
MVRERRKHRDRKVVLATGAAGNLGRLVVQALHRVYDVVAIDRRPISGLPKDVTHLQTDVRLRAIQDVFRTEELHAVVHLGLLQNPRADVNAYRFNVVGTQRLLELVARYGVRQFLMLSSANIYGSDPDNSYFLTEDAPLLGAEHHPEIRDLVAADRIVQSFFYRCPEVETVMLRPVHIVGPTVRNPAADYLRLPRPWTIMGFDPMLQLIHEADIVEALMLALRAGVKGVFNVVGPGQAPLSRILEVLGRRPRPIPSPLARSMLRRAWELKMTGFPPSELRHVQYNCVVDGTRASEVLGFTPRHSLRETILSVQDPLT